MVREQTVIDQKTIDEAALRYEDGAHEAEIQEFSWMQQCVAGVPQWAEHQVAPSP